MRGKTKTWLILALIALTLVAVFLVANKKAKAPEVDPAQANMANEQTKKPLSGKFKTFGGQEFSDLYNSFVYPNTQLINEDSPITGNEAADAKIRALAVARGYKLRSAPVTDTFVEVQKGYTLQQRAAQPWLDLQAKAKSEGIIISLKDGFRSAEDQRTIFLSRIKSISLADIAAGRADAAVNNVLMTTALPGYSRHHTGYTVDIACDSHANVKFENSKCFEWLNKDNYLNAKTFGWIPSYPDGAGNQGPDPESWEYVWVGTEILQE